MNCLGVSVCHSKEKLNLAAYCLCLSITALVLQVSDICKGAQRACTGSGGLYNPRLPWPKGHPLLNCWCAIYISTKLFAVQTFSLLPLFLYRWVSSLIISGLKWCIYNLFRYREIVQHCHNECLFFATFVHIDWMDITPPNVCSLYRDFRRAVSIFWPIHIKQLALLYSPALCLTS